jgi:hypothetical protein
VVICYQWQHLIFYLLLRYLRKTTPSGAMWSVLSHRSACTKEASVWFVTLLSTIVQLYCGDQFYWWRKLEYLEKTIDLSQVTDKLHHIMLHWVHLTWAGFEITTLVVISTNCIGSCKSTYHTITTAPKKHLLMTIVYSVILII